MATSPRSILNGADLVQDIPTKALSSFEPPMSDCSPSISAVASDEPKTEGHVDLGTSNCEDNSTSHPAWVTSLLSTKFYGACPSHLGMRKNDLNRFCMDHCTKICQYCHKDDHTSSSSPCAILHVSRYMYHDVLLAKEISTLLDVAHVQSYLNNGNRVVYIDRRAQPKSKLAPHAKSCIVCSRTLQDPFLYCSVYCRLSNSASSSLLAQIPVPGTAALIPAPPRRATRATSGDRSASPGNRRDRGVKLATPRAVDDEMQEDEDKHSRASTPSLIDAISSDLSSDEIGTEQPSSPDILKLEPGIRKSRRKGRPQLSPLASPGRILLIQQALGLLPL